MKPRSQGRFHRIKRAQQEKDFAALSQTMERLADPLEQAKSHIRSRGWTVSPDERGGWFIGSRSQQSDKDLLAFAARLGWSPAPRDEREVRNA
jgi:hypothetical protein